MASVDVVGDRRESSFGKGLRVLAWVLDHDGVRADEVATGLGLPLSSAYRFLRTLRERGFVAEADGAFTPGPTLRGYAGGPPASRVAELAAPFLEHLASVTGETAVVTVRHGNHGICVRQVESTHQIRLAFRVGQLLPLYAGAGQRVLLAFAPDHVVHAVLDRELRSYTPSTPGRSDVRRLLGRIRADRFAVSRGELTPGSVALAVPVLPVGDVTEPLSALCALCVAGPQARCPSAWQRGVRRELEQAAASLAEVLRG